MGTRAGDFGPSEAGKAGASARQVYEARKARREREIRNRHPVIAPVILALRDHPAHELAWAPGAEGEGRLAGALESCIGKDSVLLSDRCMPGSRANIDHLVVASSGVWVIDSKRYKGKVKVVRSLFGADRLMIGSWDQSGLANGLEQQVAAVAASVLESGIATPVQGVLCFVDTELPGLLTPTFRGFPLIRPRALARRIRKSGALPAARVHALARELGAAFPPA
ncbi:MAG: hypothetical protein QOG62_569 [Thermoleophilaceae bacterium]|nr:hypothetical protein [Thermoleophilaceae bacterium]